MPDDKKPAEDAKPAPVARRAIATVLTAAPRGERATSVVMEVSQDPELAVVLDKDGAKDEHPDALFGNAPANFAHGTVEVMVGDADLFRPGARFRLTLEAL